MLTIIGATLVAGTSAGFWFLLPRNGKEHPLLPDSLMRKIPCWHERKTSSNVGTTRLR